LYYRLNVARIHVPPLRERKEDIPLLTENLRRELNLRFGRSVDGIDDDVLDAFLTYDWPGNIRELRNVLEATYITAMNPTIALRDMPESVRARICSTKSIGEDERSRLIAALRSSNWNMTKAAQHLHWSRMTLYRKTAKYNIVRGGGALTTYERSKL
jgi:transcriptional regulator of acetoin/glycerol metabolism